MKVIFDHLDKTTLVTSAFQIFCDDAEGKDKIKPLTDEQISSIKYAKEIDVLNKVYIGVKFKGNYVEFDDNLADVYINLLYRMKTRNAYFVSKMKEDFIIEFEYKKYREEIDELEKDIDECKMVLKQILKQLLLIKQAIQDYPNDIDALNEQINILTNSRKQINRDALIFINFRKMKILNLFGLEGNIKEEIDEYDDDIKIKEL